MRTKNARAEASPITPNIQAHKQSEDFALWTTKRVAEYLGCAPITIKIWRQQGRGPKFVRVSPRSIRYRPEDVKTFLDSRTLKSTSEAIRT